MQSCLLYKIVDRQDKSDEVGDQSSKPHRDFIGAGPGLNFANLAYVLHIAAAIARKISI